MGIAPGAEEDEAACHFDGMCSVVSWWLMSLDLLKTAVNYAPEI